MQLAAKQNDFHKLNLEASQNRCSALLQDIFHPLEENVKQGVYSKPGGHCLFIQQRDELIAKYNQEPRKGIQVSLALCINYGGFVGGVFFEKSMTTDRKNNSCGTELDFCDESERGEWKSWFKAQHSEN